MSGSVLIRLVLADEELSAVAAPTSETLGELFLRA